MNKTLKNWIGGMLLVSAVVIALELDLGWWLVLMSGPGWVFLLTWND